LRQRAAPFLFVRSGAVRVPGGGRRAAGRGEGRVLDPPPGGVAVALGSRDGGVVRSGRRYPVERWSGDLNAAAAAVAALGGGTLVAPEGVFECDGFAQYEGTCGFHLPAGVGLVGAGPGTQLRVRPRSMTAAQRATIPAASPSRPTNQLNVVTAAGGAGTVFADFAVHGSDQDGALYNGLRLSRIAAPTVRDVLVRGIPGDLNSPPGETFGVNVYRSDGARLTRVEVDGRDDAGRRVGAAGIGTNSVTDVELRDCSAHHLAHSHGLAMWQTERLTSWGFAASDNGGPSGGHAAAGLNHERSSRCVHHAPRLGRNTLCEVRYWSDRSDTGGHELHDLVMVDDGPLDIWLSREQHTAPELVDCPPPVYTRN